MTITLLFLLLSLSSWAPGRAFLVSNPAQAFSGKNQSDPTQSNNYKKRVSKKSKKKDEQTTTKDPFYSSKKLKKIYLRQAKRQRVIIDYKKKGWVGESDDGSLKIRDIKKVSSKDRALLQKAVKVENSDRKIILKEIEKTAKYSESEKKQMRQRLFKGYLEMDPKGTYYFQADHWQVK